MAQIIAVTGITGHSGTYFLQELIRNQYSGTVRCLVRKTSKTDLLDQSGLDIEKVYGDISDAETLKKLVKGADVVLHIVNIHHSVSILKACMEENVPRVILVHTTGIYSRYKMASEEYKQIENEIAALSRDKKTKYVILRPTMIFGDLCDHNINRFIKMVDRFPVMPEIDHGKGKIQPVNARDLGKAYYQVCTTNDLSGNDYILSGERALSLHELFDMIGENLGKKIHHFSIPMVIGVYGAKFIKTISFGKIDYVERVLRMGEDRNFDHEKADIDFGYLPECFEIGLQREVEQYKSRKAK